MKHPFFEEINFQDLREKKVIPPYKFDLTANEFKYFDPRLTKQAVKDSPVPTNVARKYENFSNFTYNQM